MKRRIKGLYFAVFLIVLIGAFFVFFKSQLGESLLVSYIKNNLKIVKNFKKDYFNYTFNSYSLALKNGSNKIYIYGSFFPFEGMYEAKINKLEELTDEIQGKISSKGNFKFSKYLNILGNAIFANGYSNLRFQCFEECIGVLNGVDFDTQKLLYMLKIDLPYFKGTNTLNLILKKDFVKSTFVFNGDVLFKEFNLKDVLINGDVRLKNRENYTAKFQVYNPNVNANIFNKKSEKSCYISGKVDINLSILKTFTYYPFKSRQTFNIYQNEKVFKFFNTFIKGVYFQNRLNIDVNSMPSKLFFTILGIQEFFKGLVSGNILISKDREFSFMVKDVNLLKNAIYKFISKKVGKSFNKLNIFLIKGKFDNQKVVFNIIGKKEGENLLISIQNGVYFYNGGYKFNVEVLLNKNKYIFSVNNGNIKIKDIIKSFNKKQEILVF